jgi:hypothetical protein
LRRRGVLSGGTRRVLKPAQPNSTDFLFCTEGMKWRNERVR